MATVQYMGQCMDVSYVCSYFQSSLSHPAANVTCSFDNISLLTIIRDSVTFVVNTPLCDYSQVSASFNLGIIFGGTIAITIISLKLVLVAIQKR